jgi:hypothetical protein
MIATRLPRRLALSIGLLFLTILPFPVHAQIRVDGKVMDSKGGIVGEVDVAIYVVGNKDPVQNTKSNKTTGEYHFNNLQLHEAFDINYTHPAYENVTVSRLAKEDNQHVTKVIYLKGEKKPLTAIHEQFLSVRRLLFLANALDKIEDREAFVNRFKDSMWDVLDHKIGDMSTEPLTKRMIYFLETEQRQMQSLRDTLKADIPLSPAQTVHLHSSERSHDLYNRSPRLRRAGTGNVWRSPFREAGHLIDGVAQSGPPNQSTVPRCCTS